MIALATALRPLGYDAYNMLFGMQAWTMDTDVRAKYFNPDTSSFDYAYETGAAEAPVTTPVTGGMPIPVEGVLIGLGTMTAAAGIYLRRRRAA